MHKIFFFFNFVLKSRDIIAYLPGTFREFPGGLYDSQNHQKFLRNWDFRGKIRPITLSNYQGLPLIARALCETIYGKKIFN